MGRAFSVILAPALTTGTATRNNLIRVTHPVRVKTDAVRLWYETPVVRGYLLTGSIGNASKCSTNAALRERLKEIPFLAVNGRCEEWGPDGPLKAGQTPQTQWPTMRDTLMDLRGQGTRSRNGGTTINLRKYQSPP